MLLEVRIKLTSHILGDKLNHVTKVRELTTDPAGYAIAIPHSHWVWAFNEAARALHFDDIELSAIRPKEYIDSPTRCVFSRRFKKNDKECTEKFMAVPQNYELTFQMLLCEVAEEKTLKRLPTQKQVETMLEFIGEFCGVSQWGNKFGFGRFRVLHVKML